MLCLQIDKFPSQIVLFPRIAFFVFDSTQFQINKWMNWSNKSAFWKVILFLIEFELEGVN
jgi:hypothetical protein